MVSNENVVPVWALATRSASGSVIDDEGPMSPGRLQELRTVLATMAGSPIATLEAHDMPHGVDRSSGIHLDSASPLATHLSQLIGRTPQVTSAAGGEKLFRMVVPAKYAAQVGSGLVKPMTSTAVAGGMGSALVGPSGIVAHATYVPVTGKVAAAAGAAGGSATTVGVAAAGAGAVTVAAPLILMAVAVGMSAHAEQKRALAIEKVTELLEKLHDDALASERDSLNGCVDAIDKATAVLLDQGRIGASMGLDSAVHSISTAIAKAEARLKKWKSALPSERGARVELDLLKRTFKGFDGDGGEFRAHLELAALAIALKKRVTVLQAVEHAQLNREYEFEMFTKALKGDRIRVIKLETGIGELLSDLSSLRLDRSRGVRDVVFRGSEVDKLLNATYRLRALGDGVNANTEATDVAIEIVQNADKSVVVFPARSA